MESIALPNRSGIIASGVEAFIAGAVRKETSKSTEDDPRYYYQLHLTASDDGQGDRVYAFCDEDTASAAADRIRELGSAVPVTLDLTIGRRGTLNVDAVKYA